MIILCAFEISAWVAYITRFTEENFALLIASIYVYKVGTVVASLNIKEKFPRFLLFLNRPLKKFYTLLGTTLCSRPSQEIQRNVSAFLTMTALFRLEK